MQNKHSRVERSQAGETQERIFDDLKSISREISPELIDDIIAFSLGAEYQMEPDERACGYTVFSSISAIIRVFNSQEPKSFEDAPVLIKYLNRMVSMEARQAERDFFTYITSLGGNVAFFEYIGDNSRKMEDLFLFIQLMLSLFYVIEDNGIPEIQTEYESA